MSASARRRVVRGPPRPAPPRPRSSPRGRPPAGPRPAPRRGDELVSLGEVLIERVVAGNALVDAGAGAHSFDTVLSTLAAPLSAQAPFDLTGCPLVARRGAAQQQHVELNARSVVGMHAVELNPGLYSQRTAAPSSPHKVSPFRRVASMAPSPALGRRANHRPRR